MLFGLRHQLVTPDGRPRLAIINSSTHNKLPLQIAGLWCRTTLRVLKLRQPGARKIPDCCHEFPGRFRVAISCCLQKTCVMWNSENSSSSHTAWYCARRSGKFSCLRDADNSSGILYSLNGRFSARSSQQLIQITILESTTASLAAARIRSLGLPNG